MEPFINLVYIIAAVIFIFGIKMLGTVPTARRGNLLSAVGMLLAVVATLLKDGLDFTWIVAGLIVGSAIGGIWAKKVEMTGMPELVALFNGFGGLASTLVGWAEYFKDPTFGGDSGSFIKALAVVLTILIGAVTFTGSVVAYLKLSAKISGKATVFPLQKAVNAAVCLAIIAISVMFMVSRETPSGMVLIYLLIALSGLLGVLGVIPIGGGDMPVVISFLNSLSGLAASAAGFVIFNNVLIVAGCLVGVSGIILSVIMCKAMNRTLANVFFGGFGATNAEQAIEGEMKGISTEDAFFVLEAAQSVVIVPGYGMAVAQAQHVTKELGAALERNGAEVRYAIHPVAGRMPGHMNVLLAEADVPYDQLCEMDAVNPTMETVDVAIIVGANDVVNPAALEDENCAIYGMPIINAHLARTVFALKRGQGAGFSGLANTLFFRENCRMIYGDAKQTLTSLVAQFKE